MIIDVHVHIFEKSSGSKRFGDKILEHRKKILSEEDFKNENRGMGGVGFHPPVPLGPEVERSDFLLPPEGRCPGSFFPFPFFFLFIFLFKS